MAQSPLSRRARYQHHGKCHPRREFHPAHMPYPTLQCGVIEICSFQEHLSIGKCQDIS